METITFNTNTFEISSPLLATLFLGTMRSGFGIAVAMVTSATAGASVAWWVTSSRQTSAPKTAVKPQAVQLPSVASHHAAPWGFPSTHHDILYRGKFVNGYDRRLRIPVWACHYIPHRSLHTGRSKEADRKNSKFRSDPEIPQLFRSSLSDYKGSHYDRGHMVPAADVALVGSQKDLDETFLLSNIIPQVGTGLNRDYWQCIESFTRKLSDRYHVYVTTGPLFKPRKDARTGKWSVQYELIGRQKVPDVAVPTHVFKVILAVHPKTNHSYVASFVVPNEPIHKDTPLVEFLEPLSEVERWTGLTFFPGLRNLGVLPGGSVEAKHLTHEDVPLPGKAKPLCDNVACSLSSKPKKK